MRTKRKRPVPTATTPGSHETERLHENSKQYTTGRRACQTIGRSREIMDEQKQKPGYWAVIPAAVRYDEKLTPNAKLLYAEISSLTDGTGYCFASNAYFQGLFGLSERTIQNLLRALQVRGYIRIQDGDGGRARRKIFAGINPLQENPAEICGVTPQKFAGGGAEICTRINKEIRKEDQDPPKAPQGAEGSIDIWEPEMFARFWSMYPKKKDKVKAIREWNRLKADRKLMKEMSAALGRQIASEEWQRDEGRAIPYPCRWLNHRRWEDEIQTPPAAPRKEAVEWLL